MLLGEGVLMERVLINRHLCDGGVSCAPQRDRSLEI